MYFNLFQAPYYYNELERQSWGDDGEVDVKVHVGNNWQNASYVPGCDHLVFGNSWVTSDVYAHEVTHGVTRYTADLEYEFQSGALNEGYSDVFGALLDRDDGLMGEGIWTRAEDGAHGGTAGGTVGDGDREKGDDCGNDADDDGDGFIDEGCREVDAECGNGVDDDADGFIDEGYFEIGTQCFNGVDDDSDTFIDEGCPGSCFDGIDNGADGVGNACDPDDDNDRICDTGGPVDAGEHRVHPWGVLQDPAGRITV